MKILLDENIPRKLRGLLKGHLAMTGIAVGWERLPDGDLLRAAERAEFVLLVTADKRIYKQQNNKSRLIALLVLSTNDWSVIQPNLPRILEAINRAEPNGFEELDLAESAIE